ncbi:N-methyl-D-aspartate receptor NMDAR2C subunit [Burkholderia ubonensis]|uniref:HD domain-containing protein n=1 Tax=Burkholderia ubonensis TaxID=101571 RepID=UPI0012FA3C1F|nr:N-methyl-D-aspartate receptor NMDAR2C subunit [Burkholderia ubonensis]
MSALSLEDFQRAVTQLGGGNAAGVYAELLVAWARPTRRYHTLQHLDECLTLTRTWGAALAPAEQAQLLLAVWFHDAVYNTRESSNERLSAGWALEALGKLGVTPEASERVARLVLATEHRTPVPAGDHLTDLLLDIDLAILGAPAVRFAEYEAQVREEYGWVEDAAYAAGRGKVLAHFRQLAFSEPQTLYRTSEGSTRLTQARMNLAERA